jgi:predicted HTH transcriptional regulator
MLKPHKPSAIMMSGDQERRRKGWKMFNLIGIGEHAGSGVPDIFDIWKNEGLKEP